MDWKYVAMLSAGAIAVLLCLILYFANLKWKSHIRMLLMHMNRGCSEPEAPSKTYEPNQLDKLPSPVQRYLRKVLKPGQPRIRSVHIQHSGDFNLGTETQDKWMLFTSNQYVVTRNPGFVWDARIQFPFLTMAYVRDAYVAGTGILVASLQGLITVAQAAPGPQLNEGELLRFLAEGMWYPTVYLPGHGIHWEPIDETHATATMRDGDVSIKLTFEFDKVGFISRSYTDQRCRLVNNEALPTPWEARAWDYQERNGMLLPMQGHVSWTLSERQMTYWRGLIKSIDHQFWE